MDEIVSSVLASGYSKAALVLLATIVMRDMITGLASGVTFWLDRDFNVGDAVVLNGSKATIISIGFRRTIFEVDGVWLYIHNDRIKYQELRHTLSCGDSNIVNQLKLNDSFYGFDIFLILKSMYDFFAFAGRTVNYKKTAIN